MYKRKFLKNNQSWKEIRQHKETTKRNRRLTETETQDPCKRVIKFYFKIAMLFYDIKIEQKYDWQYFQKTKICYT